MYRPRGPRRPSARAVPRRPLCDSQGSSACPEGLTSPQSIGRDPDETRQRKRNYDNRGDDAPLDPRPVLRPIKSEPRGVYPPIGAGCRPPRAHGPSKPAPYISEECESKRCRVGASQSAPHISSYLPSNLVQQYTSLHSSGHLFEWQSQCLNTPGVLEGKSIVYCAPTSAGKSLVAEILMLRMLHTTSRVGMLVLPFVALCSEKAQHLEVLLKPLQKRVRRFYGAQNSPVIFKHDTGVLVCTIEKANILVNRMIEEGRLDQLGILVVDELHMVDDPYRGYQLELMLTKLRYMSMPSQGAPHEGLQIVGMSATMPNGDAVAKWLGAELYVTHERPVPLKQFLVIGTSILDPEGKEVRRLESQAELDPVSWLTKETVENGHSVLIFCCSKKACQLCARQLSEQIQIPARDAKSGQIRLKLVQELQQTIGDYREPLMELIQQGVAFHHAGLTAEERGLVEKAYRVGAISVLAATSTLAAGVNLPARRVIFREPYVGLSTHVLDATSYRQMAGRAGWPSADLHLFLKVWAGRAGIDDEGEAYLLESKHVKTEKLQKLIQCEAEPVSSCLGKEQNGMIRLLHEVISTGAVKTGSDVERLVQSTLLAQTPGNAQKVTEAAFEALGWLKQQELIAWQPAQPGVPAAWGFRSLGKAVTASGMDPKECTLVKSDLLKATEHLILATDLQLAYLVTPHHIELPVDWQRLYQMANHLSVLDTQVADLVGLEMTYLQKKYQGTQCQASLDRERISRRFYAALIVRDVVSEVPLKAICQNFNLTISAIEDLRERSLRYANMSATFCASLQWAYLHVLLTEFQKRIYRGARPEIVHLTEIPYVKAHRARLLYEAGFRSVEEIAELSSVEKIAKALAANQGVDGQTEGTELLMAKKILRGAQAVMKKRFVTGEDSCNMESTLGEAMSVSGELMEETPLVEPEDMVSTNRRPEREICTAEPAGRLSDSLRRLSVGSPKFVNREGIVILTQISEIQSLGEYLMAQMVEHLSFQSHYLEAHSEMESALVGVALCWSDSTVAYIPLPDLDSYGALMGLMATMEQAEIEKSTFCLGESIPWIQTLLQESPYSYFPSIVDVQEAAKVLERPSPVMHDMAGLFLLFGLEEEFQRVKEFYSLASQQVESQYPILPCCSLAALTRHLWHVLKGRLQTEGLLECCMQIQMPFLHVSENLSHRGVPLSREKIQQQLPGVAEELSQVKGRSIQMAGRDFDLSCPVQTAEILFHELNLDQMPEDIPQDDELVLRRLQDQHPLACLVLQWRKWTVLHDCLTLALEDPTHQGNQVVLRGDLYYQMFYSWLESEQELLQSLPLHRLDDSIKGSCRMSNSGLLHPTTTLLQDCLALPNGYVWMEVGYIYLDVWLLAHFSQDRALIAAIAQENIDPFRAIAGAINQKPLHEARKSPQSTADYFERFVTALLYGAGPLLSARILNVSEKRTRDCHDMFCSFFKGHIISLLPLCDLPSGVGAWMKQIVESGNSMGEIRTLFQRRLSLDGMDLERLAVRSVIQGSVIEILKRATISIQQRLGEMGELLFQSGTVFVFQIRESDREAAEKLIRDLLTDAASLNLPFPVKISTRP